MVQGLNLLSDPEPRPCRLTSPLPQKEKHIYKNCPRGRPSFAPVKIRLHLYSWSYRIIDS
jgi:hypothetical protein